MSRRGLVACVLCLVGLVVLAGIAAATGTAKKQRVVIDMKERPGIGSFELTPYTAGPLEDDSGKYTWVIRSKKTGRTEGQDWERVVADVTYEGKNGTFVAREIDTLVDAALGKRVVTGTWKLLRGTGAYENVKGSGRLAAATGIVNPSPWRYEGFMTSP